MPHYFSTELQLSHDILDTKEHANKWDDNCKENFTVKLK